MNLQLTVPGTARIRYTLRAPWARRQPQIWPVAAPLSLTCEWDSIGCPRTGPLTVSSRPTVNKGPVQVTDWDASACGSVGYGPGLELKFIIHTNKAVESEVQIVTTAELSFFKLETCVGKVNGAWRGSPDSRSCNATGAAYSYFRRRK